MTLANTLASDTQLAVIILATLFGLAILFALIVALAKFCNKFSSQLWLVNMEIGRTVGAERKRWIRKRRRLWLSLLPFVKYE